MLVYCKTCNRSVEIPNDFRKIALCNVCGNVLYPNYCLKTITDFLINEVKIHSCGERKDNSLTKELENTDWNKIIKDLLNNNYPITNFELDPRSRKSLKLLNTEFPDLYKQIHDRTYIFGKDYYTEFACCPHFRGLDGINKATIFIPECLLKLPTEGLCLTLAHEAIHIDMEEQPKKYNFEIKKANPLTILRTVEIEHSTCCFWYYECDIEETLSKYQFNEKYMNKYGNLLIKSRKKAKIKTFPYYLVTMLFTCLKGKEYNPAI